MNHTIHSQEMRLRNLCWKLGLTDTQTIRLLEDLPSWGYEWCTAWAYSIADRNAGLPNAGTDALQRSQYKIVEPPPIEPLNWRESLAISSALCFAAAVLLMAVWWVLR